MAKKEVAALSTRLAGKLKQMADQWSSGSGSAGGLSAGNAVGCWIMQATSEITPATGQCATPGTLMGITPGTGTARICHRDRVSGLIVPYRPNGQDVATTVYNLRKRKVKNGAYFFATRDLNGSIYVEEEYNFCACETDGVTITVVTKVSFDTTNCKLVVCTRQVCLPPGATVTEETCGGSGPPIGGSGSGTEVGI